MNAWNLIDESSTGIGRARAGASAEESADAAIGTNSGISSRASRYSCKRRYRVIDAKGWRASFLTY